MTITNGIGHIWEIKFVDGYYMPIEGAFATLDEIYEFIKEHKTSIESVRITKIGIEDYK